MHQPFAASAGLGGVVSYFTTTSRLWLADSRKTTAARLDEIVIG